MKIAVAYFTNKNEDHSKCQRTTFSSKLAAVFANMPATPYPRSVHFRSYTHYQIEVLKQKRPDDLAPPHKRQFLKNP